MTNEKPIIFSGEMVKAILDGRKTQTRRVVKPQPASGVRFSPFVPEQVEDGHGREMRCPYGVERLWVRETWTEGYDRALSEAEGDDQNAVSIIYKADGSEIYRSCPAEIAAQWGDFSQDGDNDPRWKPSIFLPRWASRITLEVVSVRVERLQEISDSDARAEGVLCDLNCRRPFANLWDFINAERGYGWDANPWVWVVEFERMD